MKTKANDPVGAGLPGNDRFRTPETIVTIKDGLTKREYFAAQFAAGLTHKTTGWDNVADVAMKAVQLADAMIDALNKPKL